MDDFDFLASNTTNTTATDEPVNQPEEQQQENNDDFLGNSSADQTEQQNFDAPAQPSSSNDELFNSNIDEQEDEGEVPINTNENSTSIDEYQWKNSEPTADSSDDFVENLPPTSSEILSNSSVVPEDPKVAERTARVQAINQRIADDLAARDAAEAQRKQELLNQAKQDLQRWYQERDRQMNEKRERMKSEEDTLRTSSLEKSDGSNCDWAKLIRLLEFTPGSYTTKSKRDLSRMKASIINAKRHADAKNASN